jgi:phage virion morphogenesis protein
MVQIKISYDDTEVRRALLALYMRSRDLKPVLRSIGEYVMESTQKRIKAGGPAPDGTPWQALSPGYLLVKKGPGLLRESGQLLDTLHWQLEGDAAVAIGSNKVYAAIHQFGGKTKAHRIEARNGKALAWPGAKHPVKGVNHPGSEIPARPFLGISAKDREVLLRKLKRALERAARNGA